MHINIKSALLLYFISFVYAVDSPMMKILNHKRVSFYDFQPNNSLFPLPASPAAITRQVYSNRRTQAH